MNDVNGKTSFYREVLLNRLRNSYAVTFLVQGISMFPALQEGDLVTIETSERYSPGDILVFLYGDEGLLVHRLLKAKKDKFLCKGDNCFRIEAIDSEDIYGKVTMVSHRGIEHTPDNASRKQLRLSYRVNMEFCRCGCDVEQTKKSAVYKRYRKAYLDIGISGQGECHEEVYP